MCLRPTSDAATVQARDGKVLTSHGRVAETKKQVGGCCLIYGKDLDEATSVASQLPGARTGTVQVRPSWESETRTHRARKRSPA